MNIRAEEDGQAIAWNSVVTELDLRRPHQRRQNHSRNDNSFGEVTKRSKPSTFIGEVFAGHGGRSLSRGTLNWFRLPLIIICQSSRPISKPSTSERLTDRPGLRIWSQHSGGRSGYVPWSRVWQYPSAEWKALRVYSTDGPGFHSMDPSAKISWDSPNVPVGGPMNYTARV